MQSNKKNVIISHQDPAHGPRNSQNASTGLGSSRYCPWRCTASVRPDGMKTLFAFGMKDSIFGVFYIMNEASKKSNQDGASGIWLKRWCIVSYFLDSGQVPLIYQLFLR
jgi:hypothetical protein